MSVFYDISSRNNEGSFAVRTHLHDNYEINFMLTEGVEIKVEDQTFISKKGTVCLFPPYSLHEVISNQKKYQRFVLNFNDMQIIQACSVLEPIISALKKPYLPLIFLSEEDTTALTALFQTALDTSVSDSPYDDYKKIKALGDILHFLVPLLKEKSVCSPQNRSEIVSILTYINAHLHENITVDSISKHFDMNSATLWRLFKKYLMLSPKEYILRARIGVASNLLVNGSSVADAAAKSGFNSYSHFVRAFTQQMGISPYQYATRGETHITTTLK